MFDKRTASYRFTKATEALCNFGVEAAIFMVDFELWSGDVLG